MSYTGAGYVGAVGVASYLKSTEHGGLVQPGSIGGGSGGASGVVGGGIVQKIEAKIGKQFSVNVGHNPSAQVQSIIQYLEPTLISVHDTDPIKIDIVKQLNDKLIESAQIRIHLDNVPKGRNQSINDRDSIKNFQGLMEGIGKEIDSLRNLLLPTAFAEEDPSVNSGLSYNSFEESGITLPSISIDQLLYGSQYVPPPEQTTVHIPTPPVTTVHVPPPEQTTTLPSIYGGQYVPSVDPSFVPTPEQKIKCPARVQIVSNVTNVVAGEGEFNCATIEKYEANPDYRIVYLENGFIPTPEPEPTTVHVPPPEETRCYMVHGQKLELTEQAVGYYINIGVTVTPCEAITDEIPPPSEVPTDFEYESITTDHVPPPDMPVEEPPMVTATEPGQVNWIPEPFFSFINNVFRR